MLAVAYLWYLLSSKKPVTPVALHQETVAEFEEKKVYKPLAYNALDLPQQEGDPGKYPSFNHCESVGGKTDLSELPEAQNNQMHHTMHYETSVTQRITGCSDHVDHQLQKETTELPGLEMRSSGDSVHDQTQENTTGKNHGEEESVVGGPKFSPPVYIQRYKLVKKIMQEHTIESMVDFGSNDCKITRWLKDVETLTKLYLVDIDGQTLRSGINMVKPLNCEFIIRRQYPLTVKVLEGNAGELDGRVAGCQAASLVEVVEHLEPDILKQVTHCVFGRLRPPLVVVTTPNADFNILFPNFTGFRHWDHKFEWTREEFHHWCECICTQHGYSVSYTGVGDAPVGMSHLGFCSQVGIFTRVSGKPGESTDEEVYKLVEEVVYPYEERTSGEQLADRVDYVVNSCFGLESYIPDSGTVAVIPVTDVVQQVLTGQDRERWTQDAVMKYLQSKYTFSMDGRSIMLDLFDESSSDGDDGYYEERREEDNCCEGQSWNFDREENWA